MSILDRFKRPTPTRPGIPVTDDIARRIAAHVNNGHTEEASALADTTDNPTYASLWAFRYIELDDN